MGTEIDGGLLGDQFKGYIFRITGGNDKQGFAMKQGILLNHRTRILFKKGKLITTVFRALSDLVRSIQSQYLIITTTNPCPL